MQALRKREQRAGNPLQIRSFGAFELGGLSERPHFHLCLWNHMSTALYEEPYKKGLPRPRWHIGQWPHGHVDCGRIDPGSARYVAKYTTKFETEENDWTFPIYPRKPSLGVFGLRRQLEYIARSPQRQLTQQALVTAGGRTWPMAPTLRKHWETFCDMLGLTREDEDPRYYIRDFERRFTRQAEEILCPAKAKDARARIATMERLYQYNKEMNQLKVVKALTRVAKAKAIEIGKAA